MRVVIGSILHESNTFSPIPTDLGGFRPRYGDALFEAPAAALRGIIDRLQAAGAELIPTLSAHALPGGVVVRSAYERMKAALLEGIGGAGTVDGVCLWLHGAMVVQGLGDGESDLLRSVRAAVGPGVPVIVALDMHGNITAGAVEAADGMVGYRTAPHVDVLETGERAAELLLRTLQEGARPRMGFAKLPILMPGEMAQTTYEPMLTLMRLLAETDARPGVLSSSLFKAHSWQDVYDQGSSVVVVSDGDTALAQREANRLAEIFWARRGDFNFGMEAYLMDEAIAVALAAPEKPVLLSDSGDNVTAGGMTDIPLIVERLLAQGARDAAVAAICDPAAVAACAAAGEGGRVAISIGGKLDTQHGQPLAVEGQVQRLGDVDVGPTAVLRVEGVDVVLTSERVAVTSPESLLRLGVNLFETKIVVVKLGYVPAGIAPRCILMISPGCTNCDLTQLAYTEVRRPIYPLDPDMFWVP
jgi:microcystin degradation protein MlrC